MEKRGGLDATLTLGKRPEGRKNVSEGDEARGIQYILSSERIDGISGMNDQR